MGVISVSVKLLKMSFTIYPCWSEHVYIYGLYLDCRGHLLTFSPKPFLNVMMNCDKIYHLYPSIVPRTP